ncbi:unnamed protein product [Rotaria sordida]|uniref:Potassium channel domain-containing protein n=1 Tax=Rotaria sordida TaxID=392033 RepID=A0A815Q3Z2_9BILA|nr:unnamed protein product [Rotaria sordida]CAF4126824.1 unnamed protein product [Rotaria sordida]
MIHKSTPPMFPISPLTKSGKTINRFQYYRISTKKPIPTKRISLTIITHQLTVRKFLQNRLWSIRADDYQHTAKYISMFDSMWLFIVTYTTVGYGDLTPSTYCGRTVFSITALIGVLVTALLIFVVTKKLN